MMTSLEWFAICLPLGGLAAAGLYAYALNRSADRLNANIPATPTGVDAKTARRGRYNLSSELKVETAVKRANQAASSAEAAAAKAERIIQERSGHRIREPGARLKPSFEFQGGTSGNGEQIVGTSYSVSRAVRIMPLDVIAAQSAGSRREATPPPQ